MSSSNSLTPSTNKPPVVRILLLAVPVTIMPVSVLILPETSRLSLGLVLLTPTEVTFSVLLILNTVCGSPLANVNLKSMTELLDFEYKEVLPESVLILKLRSPPRPIPLLDRTLSPYFVLLV